MAPLLGVQCVLVLGGGSSHRTLAPSDREGSQLSREDAGDTEGWGPLQHPWAVLPGSQEEGILSPQHKYPPGLFILLGPRESSGLTP